MSKSYSRFESLDGLRGWASFAVLISHFWLFMYDLPQWSSSTLQWLSYLPVTPLGVFLSGRPAVLLFFMLSGFALTCMLNNLRGGYLAYLLMRVARIWLPYAIVLLVGLLYIGLLGWPPTEALGAWSKSVIGMPIDAVSVLWCLSLIGNTTVNYSFVSWSLTHEMRLSLVFPFIYLCFQRYAFKPMLALGFALACGSVVLFYAAKILGFKGLEQVLVTGHYAIFFVVGAALALKLDEVRQWYQSRDRRTRLALMWVALALYVLPVQIDHFVSAFNFPIILTDWISLPGIFLIMLIAVAEPKAQAFLSTRLSRWLGETSYSLYLVHPFVLFASMHLFAETGMLWGAIAVGVLMSLVLARVSYVWIESPARTLGKSLAYKATR